ncbi:MAG: hypothetical protein JXO22_09835 [Phycisphaerae bacterium]|nr:hypothetical protein [Phycisphaerae bacterium]
MHVSAPRLVALGIIAFLIGSVVAQEAATSAPAASQPAVSAEVDAVLTRMEARAVQDLRAELTWERRYEIDDEDDRDVKRGQIWYKQMDPVAKFKVHFNKKVMANRLYDMDEQHVFDGRWYVELQAKTKTVTRREVRKPDDAGDPYKLGEGPFPVPFGQKKSDILREFKVTLVPPAEGDPAGTDHLKLVPREGTANAPRYAEIHFWVVRQGDLEGLPIRVTASKKAPTGRVDSHLTITFGQAKLNEGVDAGVFEIKTPVGYEEIVEHLEELAPPEIETPAP